MQSNFAYSQARARSFSQNQERNNKDEEEELRVDVYERTRKEQKKFENFWEGIRRGVHSHYIRKVSFSNAKLQHGAKTVLQREAARDETVFHPEHIYKIIWDFFIGLLVMYIVIITPVQIGFDVDDTGATLGILYFIVVCYGIDMILTFNTAYFDAKEDILIFDRTKIALHYFEFWFWFDLISTIPFDFVIGAYYKSQNFQTIRMIRVFRLVRLFKFFRVLKEAARLSKFGISSQIVNLVLLITQIFFVAHIYACFWHYITLPQAIGSFPTNWVDSFGYENANLGSRYIASLYFIVVSMLTVGYGDIHATNELERMYAIFTMITGSIVFGALISKVTSLIDKRNPHAKAFEEMMTEFKYFINETTLSKAMKERTKDAYNYYMSKKSLIGESNIFDNLAKPLLIELYFDLHRKSIEKIKLFKCSDPSFVVALLKVAKPFQAFVDDILYEEGDVCNELIFVQSGAIRIAVSDGQKMALVGCVLSGSYFGDAEYYKNICSIGQYSAIERCELLSVQHTAMTNAMGENSLMNDVFTKYCKKRYKALVHVLRSRTRVDSKSNPLIKSLQRHSTSLFQGCKGTELSTKALLWVDGELTDHLTSAAMVQSLSPTHHDTIRVLRIVNGKKEFSDVQLDIYDQEKIINPHGRYKTMWDSFIALLIFYSALVVPVETAFNADAFNGTGTVGWLIDGFFGCDVLVTFRTGYQSLADDNAIIITPWKIAELYLKGWFIIDFLSSVPFDVIFYYALGSNNSSYGGLIKALRLFRLLRLVRVFKVSFYLRQLEDFSGISPALFTLFRLLLEVYLIVHWLSCLWWGLTSVMTKEPWFTNSGPNGFYWGSLTDHPKLSAQYLVSTYFTFTSITTTGYGDIYPIHPLERLLCIFLILAGASIFGYMIANISGLLSNFSSNSASSTERIMMIREYLQERQSPLALQQKIINHFHKQFLDSSSFDVEKIVDRLPPMIGNEILFNIYSKIIQKITFFQYVKMKSVQLYLFRLLRPVYYETNHYLFKEGDIAAEMIFIISGNVRVFRKEVKGEISHSLQLAKKEEVQSRKAVSLKVSVDEMDGSEKTSMTSDSAAALADRESSTERANQRIDVATNAIEAKAKRKRLIDLSIFDSIIVPENFQDENPNPSVRSTTDAAPLSTQSVGAKFFSSSVGNRFFANDASEVPPIGLKTEASDADGDGDGETAYPTTNLRDILTKTKDKKPVSFPNVRRAGSSTNLITPSAFSRRQLLTSMKTRRQSVRRLSLKRQGSATKKDIKDAEKNLYATLLELKNDQRGVYDQLDLFDHPFNHLEADDFHLLHLELIGDLTSGDFLGHNAYMLNDGKHFTTARTTQPTTVYTLSQAEISKLVRVEPTVGIQLQNALTLAVVAQTSIVGKYLHSRKRGDFLNDLKLQHETAKKQTEVHNRPFLRRGGRSSPAIIGDSEDQAFTRSGSVKSNYSYNSNKDSTESAANIVTDVSAVKTAASAENSNSNHKAIQSTALSRLAAGFRNPLISVRRQPSTASIPSVDTTERVVNRTGARNIDLLFGRKTMYFDSDEEDDKDENDHFTFHSQTPRYPKIEKTGDRSVPAAEKFQTKPFEFRKLFFRNRMPFTNNQAHIQMMNSEKPNRALPTNGSVLSEQKENDSLANTAKQVERTTIIRRESISNFFARSPAGRLFEAKTSEKIKRLKPGKIIKRSFSFNDLDERHAFRHRNAVNRGLHARKGSPENGKKYLLEGLMPLKTTVPFKMFHNRSDDTEYGEVEDAEDRTRQIKKDNRLNEASQDLCRKRRQSFPSFDYKEWRTHKLNRFVL